MDYKILVPFDFSEVTENALDFALDVSKIWHSGVTIIHFVGSKSEEKEALAKLQAVADKYAPIAPIACEVRVGKIFDGIGQAAEELESLLVVMGTHGMSGMQYLIGSNALRVVTNAQVPFVITQKRVRRDGKFDNILIPVDMAAEDKQIVGIATRVASKLEAHVHMFVSTYKDEFTNNTVKRNVLFAAKHMAEKGVQYTITYAERSTDFEDQMLAHAETINADLIAIVNHREDGYKNLFAGNVDQKIITNEAGIPVLMINFKVTTRVEDIFMIYAK